MEIIKLIDLNGFHVFIIILIVNIIIDKGSLLNQIYTGMMLTESLTMLLIQMFIIYVILSTLSIEIGFKARIKLNK